MNQTCVINGNQNGIEKIRDEILEQYPLTEKRKGSKDRDRIEFLFKSSELSRFVLRRSEDSPPQGLIIFKGNRILDLFLSKSLHRKKLAAFNLVKWTVEELQKRDVSIIITDFLPLKNSPGSDYFSSELPLLDFVSCRKVEGLLDLNGFITIIKPVPRIYNSYLFYALDPDEYLDRILELSASNPDVMTEMLLPDSKLNEERKGFILREIWGGKDAVKALSPDFSTVVFTEKGELVGFLLCSEEGELIDLRVDKKHRNRGIAPMLLDRTVEEMRWMDRDCLRIPYFLGKDSMENRLLKLGVAVTGEKVMWGWSRWM